MISKILLILILLVTIGCGQTWIPRAVAWDYDYAEAGIDSLDCTFDVFYGYGLLDTAYVLLASTQKHELSLYDRGFNTNVYKYFYCRARGLVNGEVSMNSDTISAWFPIILDGEPYQFKVLKTKLE